MRNPIYPWPLDRRSINKHRHKSTPNEAYSNLMKSQAVSKLAGPVLVTWGHPNVVIQSRLNLMGLQIVLTSETRL